MQSVSLKLQIVLIVSSRTDNDVLKIMLMYEGIKQSITRIYIVLFICDK